MLSQQAISEYMTIYKQQFGEEITQDEANRQGSKLLRLMRLIYRPIPKDWLEELDKKYAKSK